MNIIHFIFIFLFFFFTYYESEGKECVAVVVYKERKIVKNGENLIF